MIELGIQQMELETGIKINWTNTVFPICDALGLFNSGRGFFSFLTRRMCSAEIAAVLEMSQSATTHPMTAKESEDFVGSRNGRQSLKGNPPEKK